MPLSFLAKPKGTHSSRPLHARSTSTLRKCSPVSGYEAPRFTLTPWGPPPSPLPQDPLWRRNLKRCSRQHKGPGRARNHGRRPARSKPGSWQRSDRQPREPPPAAPDATLTCGRPTKAGEDSEGKDRWRLPPRKSFRELSLKSSQGPKSGSSAPAAAGPGRWWHCPPASRLGAQARSECPGLESSQSPLWHRDPQGRPGGGGRGPARGKEFKTGRIQPREAAGPRASSGGVQPGRV